MKFGSQLPENLKQKEDSKSIIEFKISQRQTEFRIDQQGIFFFFLEHIFSIKRLFLNWRMEITFQNKQMGKELKLSQVHEYHGPSSFHSSNDIHPPKTPTNEIKKPTTWKDELKSLTKFISTESASNSDDLDILGIPFDEVLSKSHLLHKNTNNSWVEYFCVLTLEELSMYKNKKCWEQGDESVNSCFIKTSVLEFPDAKEHKWCFSLFSHNKEGKH